MSRRLKSEIMREIAECLAESKETGRSLQGVFRKRAKWLAKLADKDDDAEQRNHEEALAAAYED